MLNKSKERINKQEKNCSSGRKQSFQWSLKISMFYSTISNINEECVAKIIQGDSGTANVSGKQIGFSIMQCGRPVWNCLLL